MTRLAPPASSTVTSRPSSTATSRMSTARVIPPTRWSLTVIPSATPLAVGAEQVVERHDRLVEHERPVGRGADRGALGVGAARLLEHVLELARGAEEAPRRAGGEGARWRRRRGRRRARPPRAPPRAARRRPRAPCPTLTWRRRYPSATSSRASATASLERQHGDDVVERRRRRRTARRAPRRAAARAARAVTSQQAMSSGDLT